MMIDRFLHIIDIVNSKKYAAWIVGIFLFLFITLISLMFINGYQDYCSDDYAAYMNEGISISEGDFENGIRRNAFMHSEREDDNGTLTYAWGFPLILALIHRIVGWDSGNPEMLLYYKLPGVIFAALAGVILYLFFRRRFSTLTSFSLSLICILTPYTTFEINTIQTDIPCLFFCFLSFYLTECYCDISLPFTKKKLLTGLLCGLSYLCVTVVRLNGISAVLACVVLLLCNLWKKRKPFVKQLFSIAFPLLTFGILFFLSMFIFPMATSNTSDIGQTSLRTIKNIAILYYQVLDSVLKNLFTTDTNSFFYANCFSKLMMLLGLLGFLLNFHKDNNCYLSIFFAGNIIILLLLNYAQGFRYFLNIFPIFLMYNAYALRNIRNWLNPSSPEGKKIRFIGSIVILVTMGMFLYHTSINAISSFQTRNDVYENKKNLYCNEAVEMYDYVKNNIPETDTIVFYKNRALYLNTNRLSKNTLSIRENTKNDIGTEKAKWLIVRWPPDGIAYGSFEQYDEEAVPLNATFELCWQNERYRVYRIVYADDTDDKNLQQ